MVSAEWRASNIHKIEKYIHCLNGIDVENLDMPIIPITKQFLTCPTSLTQDEIDRYWQDGWLAFEGALTSSEVDTARSAISEMVRRYADPENATYTPGNLKNDNQSGGVFRSKAGPFNMQLEQGFEPDVDNLAGLETAVRKFMKFENECPLFQSIVSDHPRIQGILRSLLGSVEIYQSMALIKPAYHGSEKPWHQDNAYFGTADLDGVIGTWIALDDVLVENGCMHMLTGGHKLGPLRHHHTFDCEIVPGKIQAEKAEPVELRAGGIVIFHANTPHQTPPNRSSYRRRALQFHFKRTDNPIVSVEEYDKIYAEADGSPASCAYARKNGF